MNVIHRILKFLPYEISNEISKELKIKAEDEYCIYKLGEGLCGGFLGFLCA